MYKAWKVVYSSFCANCDSLMLCIKHFWKKMIFHEIFQVGACPQLKDSSLYERYSIHIYKTRSIRSLQQCSSTCDFLMPCTVHCFGKRWFLMKYFKLVHASTWKIPHYMTSFLPICTRHDAFGFFDCFALSTTPLCVVRYIFSEKNDFHEIFQVGPCPNLKDSSLYDRFSIHMYKVWSIRYFQYFSLSATPLWLVRYIFWTNMNFQWTISSWCIPQLERFSLYERFSIHMYKAWGIRYLQLFLRYLRLANALQGTSFWKTMIFHEVFQVAACPNLKDSSLYVQGIHIYKAWNVRSSTFLPLSASP